LNKRLENAIRKVFPIDGDSIDENWTSDEIPEWDSVGHLDLIMEVEREFAMKIEIEEMFEIEKLGDIEAILLKKNVLD